MSSDHSSSDDAHIDPALRFLDNCDFSEQEQGTSYEDEQDEIEQAAAPGQVFNNPGPQNAEGSFNCLDMVAMGAHVKNFKKFSNESEAKFDEFCRPHPLEECLVVMEATLLEIRDMLKVAQKGSMWQVTEELKKKSLLYSQALLLSPNLAAYRGDNAEVVFKALRDLKVQDMPPDSEPAHCKEVISIIKSKLTSQRNVLKDKIALSVTPKGQATKNIADLAAFIVAGTSIPLTLDLYMRVAFLRFHITQYSDLGETEWWPQVDATITAFRERSGNSAAKLLASFKAVYDNDKKLYGDPAVTKHKAVDPTVVSAWIKTMNTYAESVQGATPKPTKKRRRANGTQE